MSTASNALKTAVFTLIAPVIVAGVVPHAIAAGDHANFSTNWLLRIVGTFLIVAGTAGYVWCAALFVKAEGTPAPIFPTQKAVVSGPYRINRNPMYTSVLGVIVGQAAWYGSRKVLLYGVAVAIAFHLFVVLYEERDLRARFNGEYEEFCRSAPRWIPRLRR